MLLVLACGLFSCNPNDAPSTAASNELGNERTRILGPFLGEYWQLPVPPQGSPEESLSEAGASLDPRVCGACHPKQFAEWRDSFHANAFSPGFAGQLIEGSLSAPHEIRGCQRCHAPLSEQQPHDTSGGANAIYDEALRATGVVCAGCHVRQHRRFGPPRRDETDAPPEPLAHDGFEARAEFQESRFCATCHQFFDDMGIEGKAVENTFLEWERSPQATAGRSCQSCHMPDREHRWRGIHDPEMVRSAIESAFFVEVRAGTAFSASLVLRSHDVGHRFPTYVTPRVFLAVWQEDRSRTEIPETRQEAAIGREVNLSEGTEVFDTRVVPGGSVKLDYRMPRRSEARFLAAEVRVEPDFLYRRIYETLLATYADPVALQKIREAYERTLESPFVVESFREELPERG